VLKKREESERLGEVELSGERSVTGGGTHKGKGIVQREETTWCGRIESRKAIWGWERREASGEGLEGGREAVTKKNSGEGQKAVKEGPRGGSHGGGGGGGNGKQKAEPVSGLDSSSPKPTKEKIRSAKRPTWESEQVKDHIGV